MFIFKCSLRGSELESDQQSAALIATGKSGCFRWLLALLRHNVEMKEYWSARKWRKFDAIHCKNHHHHQTSGIDISETLYLAENVICSLFLKVPFMQISIAVFVKCLIRFFTTSVLFGFRFFLGRELSVSRPLQPLFFHSQIDSGAAFVRRFLRWENILFCVYYAHFMCHHIWT